MAFLFHDIVLDDTAFKTASDDMASLKQQAADLKTKLEKMYEKAETENADMVQCNLYDIYPDRTRKIQLKPLDKTVIVEDKGEYADKYFSTCYHSYEICNKLIRRSFLEENNLKFCDTKKYFSEDLMFNLKMLSCLKKV